MARKGSGRRRTIRVGVVGVGRGQTFARQAVHAGMELVALCDLWAERLLEVVQANVGSSAAGIQDAIIGKVRQFVGTAPQSDDMTLMVLVRG